MFKVHYTAVIKGYVISGKGSFTDAKKEASDGVTAEMYKALTASGRCGEIKSVQCIETKARSF